MSEKRKDLLNGREEHNVEYEGDVVWMRHVVRKCAHAMPTF